jgi:hypothetical protein
MMSLATIRQFANQQAAKAARAKRQPYIVEAEELAGAAADVENGRVPELLDRIPNIGSYQPPGWVREDYWTLAKYGRNGIDGDGGSALSVRRLVVATLEAGKGYAFIEEGAFQIVIAQFDKVPAQAELKTNNTKNEKGN